MGLNIEAQRLGSKERDIVLIVDSKLLTASSMESFSSNSQSYWNHLNLLLLRPALAILFVVSFIFLWWWLAWKIVLGHVPLVQEIFGLRKKPVKRKPPTRPLSRYYNSIIAHNSTSE